jgi:hypothetical protein
MLRFMEWSVVAMGGALVFMSVGIWWWRRTKAPMAFSPDQGMRFYRARYSFLMGLGMIGAQLPKVLLAPHTVVMIMDTLNLLLAVTVMILLLRGLYRSVRPRDPRTVE